MSAALAVRLPGVDPEMDPESRAWVAALAGDGGDRDAALERLHALLLRAARFELGREYVKIAVREMPTIPLMSYNVFTVMDETYWTGYPSAESAPYTDPVPNWANTKYMMVRLKPRR